jgi:triosephosphate isomerase
MIAGNWKMNNSISESLKLIASIQHHLQTPPDNVDVVVIPPTTSLYSVGIAIQDDPISLGGQNLYWEDNGAFTGESSGTALKDLGCDYVLVGHSERRKYFGDTNEACNKKIFAALRNELIPIFCVGETLEERESGKYTDIVEAQVKEGLATIHSRDAENIIVAYEPVWAIGTGKTASPEQAQEMHHFIRNLIEKLFDAPTAGKIRILYGGSVKPSNSAEILTQKDVDGALVGGASLNGKDFAEIVLAAPHKDL